MGVRGDGGGRKGKASAAKHEISLVGGEGVRAQTPQRRIRRREGRGGGGKRRRREVGWSGDGGGRKGDRVWAVWATTCSRLLDFFYPSSEALAAEAGLHFLLVLVESPI